MIKIAFDLLDSGLYNVLENRVM